MDVFRVYDGPRRKPRRVLIRFGHGSWANGQVQECVASYESGRMELAG